MLTISATKRIMFLGLALLLIAIGIALREVGSFSGTSGGQLWAVIVEESAERKPWLGAIITNAEIRKQVASVQGRFHPLDVDAKGPDVAEVQWALDFSKDRPKPILLIRKGDRIQMFRVLTPSDTPQTVGALLAKYGG